MCQKIFVIFLSIIDSSINALTVNENVPKKNICYFLSIVDSSISSIQVKHCKMSPFLVLL